MIELQTQHASPPREIRVDADGPDDAPIRLGSRWSGEWYYLTAEEARRVGEALIEAAG